MGFVRFGPSTVALYGAVDLGSYFNEASVPAESEVEDATTCGKTARVYLPTLTDGTASVAGLWDGAVAAVDEVLSAALFGPAAPLTIAWDGLAVGRRVSMLDAVSTSYQVSGAVGGLVEVEGEFQGSGPVRGGVALHALTAESVTGQGASADGGAATTGGAAAHLHASAVNGTLAAKVQHSADNSTWVDLAVFTTRAAPGSERRAFSGTVNRYLRAFWTITTGPSTFAIALART